MKARKAAALTSLIGLLAAACTGAKPRPTPAPSVLTQTGGTLRIGVPTTFTTFTTSKVILDPQKDYILEPWELFRCCLLRTLLGFDGKPTGQGGTVLRPDLATALPEVSADGLTWTFHLKRGLRYAPPLQRVQITAGDIIRALEREANPTASAGGYSYYYSVLSGFDDAANGKAESISGLEAPDPFTLRVHLVHPEGDLGYLFTLAATAPIPPNPFDPSARLGAAEGHDADYGGFLVASGPYMLQGSEKLDLSRPPADQRPVAGRVPEHSVTLVRNPSWRRSTDPLRPAYVDRIDVTLGGTLEGDSTQIDAGALDLILYPITPPQVPPDQLARYRASPAVGTVDVEERDAVRYISMNLAVPPFDDIHVRRAMNYAVDRRRIVDLYGGPSTAQVTGHISLDSLESNLLLSYNPYRTAGDGGDLAKARAEIALSPYDANHDGICDAAVCRNLRALTLPSPSATRISMEVAKELRGIGIDIRVEPRDDIFSVIGDPKNHIPLAIDVAWLKDIPAPSNYFTPLFEAVSLATPETNSNYSLLGATPGQLTGWGYGVSSVLGVDDRIAQCEPATGPAAVECWTGLDQYLMEDVVPWVPLMSGLHVQVVPKRITHYSYDQFADLPALDQIALR